VREAKIHMCVIVIIDINNNLEHFVATKIYYDSSVLVKIVRNDPLCLPLLLTKGSNVMLSMLPTKDRKYGVYTGLY